VSTRASTANPEEVEAREPVRAHAEHRDAERLEALQRGTDVEDRLHPGAHHRDAGPAKGHQVRRLVEGRRRAAVHTAQPARGEDADPQPIREVGRRRDGGGAMATTRDDGRKVTDADLRDVAGGGDRLERVGIEPDADDPGDDGDRRRHGASGPHRLLDLVRDREVGWPRQPVADDRGLERDDGLAARERVLDLRVDDHDRGHAIGAGRARRGITRDPSWSACRPRAARARGR
jgi:hypothetical protein